MKFLDLKERLKSPFCNIGLNGFCCKNCLMGPCIVKNSTRGACGADREVVTSRNILRFVAAGCAAHVGHAYHLLTFLKKKYPANYIKKKAPSYLFSNWNELGIVPRIQFEHFKDISEASHLSTMGTNADFKDIIKWAMKLGIVDGYYGMYLATELEDKTYGKPVPKEGLIDLGVIDEKKINIAVHGHEPMLADELARKVKNYKDINLIGVCCTGAGLLARYGIPLVANVVLQEDVIASGAIEVLVTDVQCIMPSLADLAECYHTKIITTHELARIPNAIHLPIKNNASQVAEQIIKIAKANRTKRRKTAIQKIKRKVKVGYTEDSLDLRRITDEITDKKIRGIIAIVGCTNPRIKEDWISLYKQLSKDYLILTTGCMGFKLGQAGLLDGKRVFHLGSCVNNARVAEVFKRIADAKGKEITDFPFLVSCPMPITEKAIAIGFFFASLGVDVHFGYPFLLSSDTKIAYFLEKLLKEKFKSKIFLEASPSKLMQRMKKYDGMRE